MLDIYLDADGSPVKDETFKVAGRYGLRVYVVANAWQRLPDSSLIERVIVPEGLDVADDWIAERAGVGDIVVTADVPLAARAVKRGARALTPSGRALGERSIGEVLATRNLLTGLREAGQVTGGPRPFSRQDRSRFLGALDEAINAIRRLGR